MSSDKERDSDQYAQLTMKRYASPGGATAIKITETKYCVKSPAKGVLSGLLLAKNEEYGRTSSRPSSWMTIDCLRTYNYISQLEATHLCLG
jgi:hypothetical protein